jgi:hypothetical protein
MGRQDMNIVRAIVRAYDAPSKTATIELTGSMASALSGVPVLRPAATTVNIAVGNTVLVAILDDGSAYVMATIDGAGPDADTVDGYHAKTSGADAHVVATDAAGNATISGGLNVGTATGAGPGDAALSGDIFVKGDGTVGGLIEGPGAGHIANWISTYYSGAISVTAANTPIASLSRGTTNQYGGLLVVNAFYTTGSNTNSAHYVLLVVKAPAGSGVVEIAKQGLTAGGGASWPSFTWSLDTTNNHLEASPIGSTTGTFYFAIQYMGTIKLAGV